jgi:formylglycine-generating enzyme required for sulfatase activity
MAGAGLPVTTRRAVRGGSWNNNQNNAHCAYRNNNNPNNRNNNIGFRLLCSSHILSPPTTAQV